MLTRRFLSLLAASATLAAAAPAWAQGGNATAFIQDLGGRIVAVVNGPGDVQQKRAQIQPLVESAVDVGGIARFCLGRFVRSATPQQLAEYTRLFHYVLLNSITGKLGQYRGVSFSMTSTQQRDGEVLVGSIINRPNQQPANVQWVVGSVGGQMKIVDVVIEGTSLRLTQRSDYSAYMSRNGNSVDALIGAMRQQVGA